MGDDPAAVAPAGAVPAVPASAEPVDWIKRLGDAFGVIGAAATLVFVTGGTVVISRLYVYKLAALEVVVGQIPQAVLVTTGLVEVVAPCAAVATIYLTYRLIEATSGDRWLLVGWPDQSWRTRFKWLGFFFLVGFLLWAAILEYWLVFRLGGCRTCTGSGFLAFLVGDPPLPLRVQPLQFWLVALVAILLFVVMGFLISARLAKLYRPTWNSVRPVALMTIVWALVLIPAFITFDAILPLADVRVCTSDGARVVAIDGFLVAETNDAVFVADRVIDESDPNATRSLISIPTSRVVEVFSGSTSSTASCPSTPGP